MRVLYQPVQANPQDWQETDGSSWAGLGSFDVNALNVQGVVFEGADQYGVRVSGDHTIVAVWHNDPADWPVGMRWAREVTFRPLAPSTDPRLGGAITTQQTTVIYAEGGIRPSLEAAYVGVQGVSFDSWGNFNPGFYAYRAGRWLSDQQYAAMQARRSVRGWREWTEGLDPSEIGPNGQVKDQRTLKRYVVPKGTRTYYHDPVAGPSINGANTTNSLVLVPTGAVGQPSGNVGTNGATCFEAIAPVNEPDAADWSLYAGQVRYQLDVTVAGSDLVFGLLNLGAGGNGGFLRVNGAADTELQRVPQDQVAFGGSGLFLASADMSNWTAGAQTDRYGVLIAGQRVVGHGNQQFTLQTGELDDFTDGPWPAAVAAVGDDALFFGINF